jgi:ATP-binding cassette subfamily B protein/subfamily B ATP-binding cassette protein MsbA
MIAALRLLAPSLRPFRGRLLLALAAMLGEILTALVQPIPIQRMFDLLVRSIKGKLHLDLSLGGAGFEQLLLLGAFLVLIALADAVVTYVDLRESARVAQNAVTDLRRLLFAHLQRLSLAYHQSADTRLGDVQLRLSGDVQSLQDVVGTAISNLVTNSGTALLMLAALFLLEWRIGLLALAGSIPIYLLSRHYQLKFRAVVREARKQEGRISAMLSETLGAAKLVQAFGQEGHENVRLHRETARGLDFGLRASEYQARVQPLVSITTSVVTALVLLLAAVFTTRGLLTIGQLTLVLAYTRGTFAALRQLARLPVQTQKAQVASERLNEILSRAPAVTDPPHPRPLPSGALALEFDQVVFGYSEGRPVIRSLSWGIPAGSTAALVGPTGAGKSTLLSLVPRFYDVWQGSVRLGGVDVRETSLAELRAGVTLVLQESLLFRDTVWNNIAYGRPDATREQILEAADAAGVTTFVEQLDEGFDTMVSERGATLSGGQKQCVAIARAILRDSPLVIMDEPTSNLDLATEHLVIRGIRKLIHGRTAVIIAHRETTIRHADVVAVMKAGRLIEIGEPARILPLDSRR